MDTRIFVSSIDADRFPLGINRTDDVAFDLHEPIAAKGSQQMYIQLENFSCPISRYNVRPGFNNIIINTTTYTIATGQYNTPAEFVVALQTAIGSVLTVSYSPVSNKISFQNATASPLTIKKGSTAGIVIGINRLSDLVVPANTTVAASKMVDMTGGLRAINVVLKNFDLNTTDSVNGSALGNNVLYSIPVSVA
jgi:hypothetical protein